MNIQDIEKEFDEKFAEDHFADGPWSCEKFQGNECSCRLKEQKAFLTQKLREVMESVNPTHYVMDALPARLKEGYSKCHTDIETNITNFFKEL